ncbi:MAG: PLDc N-terminal domain-containing protein [Candidatus Sumerlaeia bacterium]|nr:PLDc N-terminal domain-containing protein [Candidatus Sumerlaeia bacterium]
MDLKFAIGIALAILAISAVLSRPLSFAHKFLWITGILVVPFIGPCAWFAWDYGRRR